VQTGRQRECDILGGGGGTGQCPSDIRVRRMANGHVMDDSWSGHKQTHDGSTCSKGDRLIGIGLYNFRHRDYDRVWSLDEADSNPAGRYKRRDDLYQFVGVRRCLESIRQD